MSVSVCPQYHPAPYFVGRLPCPSSVQEGSGLTGRTVIPGADHDAGLGAGRMDDLAAADIDRHMVDRAAAGIEEKISRLYRIDLDLLAISRLIPGAPAGIDPKMLIDPHHEAGTIRPVRQAAAAVYIGVPQELLRVSHDRRPGSRGDGR